MPSDAAFYNSDIMKFPANLRARAACLAALLLAPVASARAQEAAVQAPEAITIAARAYLLEQLAGLPGEPSVAIDPPGPNGWPLAMHCPHLCRQA